MTRLNLNETCLLEASGELDESARRRLQEYFVSHPAARGHFERLKSEMDLLRSLPRPVLTEEQKRHYAAAIKQGIHHTLRQKEREEQALLRRKFIYRALAGVSAAAAALVVVVGLMALQQSIEQNRRAERIAAVNNAVDHLTPFQDSSNSYDDELRDVATSIQELESESPSVAGLHDTEMSNLLDALASVPGDADSPPVTPGSL